MSLEISCGYLHTIQRMADDIWADPMKNNDLIADVITTKAVLENQSVKFEEITGAKNNELRVEWLTKCNPEVSTECSTDCTITGADAEPTCKDYEIECVGETSFKVPLRHYRDRTIEMQQSIAFQKLVHMTALDERLTQAVIAGLVATGGTNLFTGGIGHVHPAITYIASQYWDDAIWGYFDQVKRLNKFRNPYLINGNNLYQLIFNRPLEAGNANGVGNFRKMNTLKVYQDPENIEDHAPGQSFLIHKNAVALLSKAWNKINPINAELKAGQYWEWAEESKNLPGIFYDFTMKETCENNDFYQAYKIKAWGLFAVNPFPCNENNTGVLVFECGSEPA